MTREDPIKVEDHRLEGKLSGGRSFWAEGTADAKALRCLCIPGTAWSQSDLRVSDSLEGR